MMQQFIESHKKALTVTLILIAVVLIGGITVFALSNPPDEGVAVVSDTSSEESSVATSSITVSVPEIKKPEPLPISSVPTSSAASSAASSAPVSSAPQPKLDITSSVDQKPTTAPAATSPKPPASSAPAAVESKPQTPPEGDLMPQPNPDFAKPANRNMPSFTVDSSVMGPGGSHGQFDGSRYYHAGCDTWMTEQYFFAYRYGQHPEATDYLNHAPQVSPYQQDGDYDPFNAGLQQGSGCYYCKACNGWISAGGWENGKHGSGRNHIANTKKLAQ